MLVLLYIYIYIYIYINSNNISPIMIINRAYEHENLLSPCLVSFLVGLRTYQHPCRSYTTTHLWTSDHSVAETSTWQHTTLTKDKHPCLWWDSKPNLIKRAAADVRLRPRGHWDRLSRLWLEEIRKLTKTSHVSPPRGRASLTHWSENYFRVKKKQQKVTI